jgi:hypothetical protein
MVFSPFTDTESLPSPDIVASEIADELEAAFDLFTKIAAKHTKKMVGSRTLPWTQKG